MILHSRATGRRWYIHPSHGSVHELPAREPDPTYRKPKVARVVEPKLDLRPRSPRV